MKLSLMAIAQLPSDLTGGVSFISESFSPIRVELPLALFTVWSLFMHSRFLVF